MSERQRSALRSSHFAVAALHDYSSAYRQDLNSHGDGVTAIAILKLLEHLRMSTGLDTAAAGVDDIFDLIPAVRLGARADLERGGNSAGAHATLAELYLLSGDQASPEDRDKVLYHYAQAGVDSAVSAILVERLDLFAGVGFRPALTAEALGVLDAGHARRLHPA